MAACERGKSIVKLDFAKTLLREQYVGRSQSQLVGRCRRRDDAVVLARNLQGAVMPHGNWTR